MPLMDVGNVLVWHAMKLYLPLGTRLTSVYRSPAEQFKFIVQQAQKHGYKFAKEPVLGDRSSWIDALEFVRKKGYKVAEPGRSYHQRGMAYDLAGPDLQKIKEGVLCGYITTPVKGRAQIPGTKESQVHH